MPISTVRFSPSSLGFLLNDISRKLRLLIDAEMNQLGLTQTQWRALLTIATMEGCTQRQLADILEVQPISLARLVDRMVSGGWVRREPSPADRRAHQLFLTSKCDPVLELAQDVSKRIIDRAYRGLSEAERAQLIALLERVKTNLLSDSL